MIVHTCFLKCMEIRLFNTFSFQKGWEMSSEPNQNILPQVRFVKFAAFAFQLDQK